MTMVKVKVEDMNHHHIEGIDLEVKKEVIEEVVEGYLK